MPFSIRRFSKRSPTPCRRNRVASFRPARRGELPVPVSTWTFDEKTGNTSVESSGSGSPAQLKNGAEIIPGGVAGNALSLDGVDDYAEIDSAALNGKEQFTISLWVNMTRLPQLNYSLIGKEGGDTDNAFRLTILPSGAGHFVMRTPESNWYSTVAAFDWPLQPNRWHQVAMTYDGKNARVYVDGEEEGMSGEIRGGLMTVANPIRLGYQSATNIEYAQADMDELRLYDRALTGDQVAKLFSLR
ncbi:LamG domain-containing protein [Cohnella rhizosphaerae]|uniref:LamG domain-containing protein n=1 Tax=Cohnella rhizosphaerae TaxID=1457232 RepID=A0A9X4KRI5_9BACL|nr:LamG domain-containing protein [Cohnella rhizosphaerae]MDG0809794.1 LamG domain-containing protein [Cohnella rhizosphaerae]